MDTHFETIDITYYCNPKRNWSSTKPLKDGVEMIKHATVVFDGTSYTMSFTEQGKGGPIVSDVDKDSVIKKFMDALELCFAVSNLANYMR